jgi:hypothetical protein
MATYATASKQLLDDYACISTLEPTDIQVGDSVVVGSLGAPFNGTFTVLSCPQYRYTGVDSTTGEWTFDQTQPIPNQVLYACTGDNVDFVAIYHRHGCVHTNLPMDFGRKLGYVFGRVDY